MDLVDFDAYGVLISGIFGKVNYLCR